MILVHLYRYTTFVMEDSHMGQISQPQHKNAGAGENRDIGSYMIELNVLENSAIAAVSF